MNSDVSPNYSVVNRSNILTAGVINISLSNSVYFLSNIIKVISCPQVVIFTATDTGNKPRLAPSKAACL